MCVCGLVVQCRGCAVCESNRSYRPAAVIVASMRVQLALRGMWSALRASRSGLRGLLLRRGYRRSSCRSVSAKCCLRLCVHGRASCMWALRCESSRFVCCVVVILRVVACFAWLG